MLAVPAAEAQTIANPDKKFHGSVLDRPAMFPGDSLLQFLQSNLRFPESSPEGRVVVQFDVSASGQLSHFSILQSSCIPELDEEALRVCRLMPPYQPALVNGTPAGSTVRFPLLFE